MRGGLPAVSGKDCGRDEVEHVLARLNVVRRELPRCTDGDCGLIRRLVVGLGESNSHRDPPREVEEQVQAPRFRPGGHVSGVSAGGVEVTARRGQHPEVGEKFMANQCAALWLLRHFQACRPDLLSLFPTSGSYQVQHHHAATLDRIDGCAVLAELGEGLLERNAKVSHGVDAIRRVRQQNHLGCAHPR